MFSQTCHVDTAQGNRLITRLGRHWGHKFAVELSEEALYVPFDAQCSAHLQSQPAALTITLQHQEAEALPGYRQVLESHLQRFAGAESLPFSWTPVAKTGAPADAMRSR